jgi:polysaccharide biosynthesis/export protein
MAAKQIVRLVFVVAVVAGWMAHAAAQSNPKISPRDVLKIEVFGISEFDIKARVDADGYITFPPIEKPVKVAGLTVREVEVELARRLKDDGWLTVMPKIAAELEQTMNKKVMVTGEVRNPGPVAFAGELKAGSTTQDASDVALIIRAAAATPPAAGAGAPVSEIVEVNLRALQDGNPTSADLTLGDGDRVVVRKAEQVFLDGFVSRPGAYSVTPGMTLKQVIVLAGGISERGNKNRISIRRNGKDVKGVKYDTTTVMPGDTITVKSRIF